MNGHIAPSFPGPFENFLEQALIFRTGLNVPRNEARKYGMVKNDGIFMCQIAVIGKRQVCWQKFKLATHLGSHYMFPWRRRPSIHMIIYLIAQTAFLIRACITVGDEIGQLPTEQHEVSGTLHVTDSRTLSFEGFNYDGLGPGNYFA